MVKIRLKRMGRKKLPIYKIVVAESMSKRDGRAVDILGTYNPKSKELQIDVEKVKEWLAKGDQPTDRVAALLKRVVQ
ncbi:30S ribosomal protein S16 [Desulfurobacterium crinifex]